MSAQHKTREERGVSLRTRDHVRLSRPRMYRVLLHNDDYTPMDFVVNLLRVVFHKDESDAMAIMLHVHHHGVGVAGVYTHEVGETKVAQVHMHARKVDCPLMASLEPEDPPDAER